MYHVTSPVKLLLIPELCRITCHERVHVKIKKTASFTLGNQCLKRKTKHHPEGNCEFHFATLTSRETGKPTKIYGRKHPTIQPKQNLDSFTISKGLSERIEVLLEVVLAKNTLRNSCLKSKRESISTTVRSFPGGQFPNVVGRFNSKKSVN